MKAYITNLHAYNSGILIGEWVDFPIDDAKFNEVMQRIGVNPVLGDYSDNEEDAFYKQLEISDFSRQTKIDPSLVGEEWFVTDYEFNLPVDWKKLGEHPSLDALNTVGEIDEDADYDRDVNGLRDFCYEHSQEQVIEDIVDDDLINEMVIDQVQSGDFHWSQLITFLPDSAYYDQYKINGYGNIVPLESDDIDMMWDEAVDNVIDDAIR